jgi:hypothetical protein
VLFRAGAQSVSRRLLRLHHDRLDASPEALENLLYLEKRKDNMRCGWLRKNGCHAAVRVLKQAGLHWRLANAVRMARGPSLPELWDGSMTRPCTPRAAPRFSRRHPP